MTTFYKTPSAAFPHAKVYSPMYSGGGGMKVVVETKFWTFWGHDLKGHMPSNNTVVYSLEYV